MLTPYVIYLLMIAVVITAVMMLVRIIFMKQVRETTARNSADVIVWTLFHSRWNGKVNEILYTWRVLLYDLQKEAAPPLQIEAAKRQVRYYENKLTVAKWLVTSHGRLRQTVIRGEQHG